jgi:hypothetical protein
VEHVEYGNHTWSKTSQGAETITAYGPIRDKAQGTVTTFWLDADTYLPLRTVSESGKSGFTTESAYLPPTAANLAKLTAPVPAGFKQTSTVEPPKG